MLVPDVIGALGGVLLAVGLLPQVWKIFTTRSAKDISYVWTGMYFVGLSLTLVYLVMVSAIVGAVAGGAELLFVSFIIAGKAALDCGFYASEKTTNQVTHDVECGMSIAPSLSSTTSEDSKEELAPNKNNKDGKFPMGT